MTAGAVALATMLTLLIWMPPEVHGKISAVTPSGQARLTSRESAWPHWRPLELGVTLVGRPRRRPPCPPARQCRVFPQEAVMGWIDFGAVTRWAVAVAFLVTFVFGWFWYSPQGFFPLWRRLDKISSDDMENANMGIAFGGRPSAICLASSSSRSSCPRWASRDGSLASRLGRSWGWCSGARHTRFTTGSLGDTLE